MKITDFILSKDFLAAIFATIVSIIFLPQWIDNNFAKDIYAVAISILSIIFSVYFAALAIIISSSDDAFVKFLIKENVYDIIIDAFKITLLSLFISLVYSICIYIFTSNWLLSNIHHQPILGFSIFIFLFTYSLFATGQSAIDSLKYAKKRSEYLSLIKPQD